MYKIAMTQWIVGDEPMETTFQRLNKLEYDGIELAAEPHKLDYRKCQELLDKYNLKCYSLCGIFDETRDLSSASEARKFAVDYLKDSIDFAVLVGAKVVICVPSPVGRVSMPNGVTWEELWENVVKSLREAGNYAKEKGVSIAIEAINRYETFFINSVIDAYKLARDVDLPSVGIMADLFHMNIEEKDIFESLEYVKNKLIHVHIADSNRAPAGYGHTDFTKVIKKLKDIHYAGTLTAEFMYSMADPYSALDIKTQTALMDKYAEQNIMFIKKIISEISAE